MKHLWNWIDRLSMTAERKYNVCLWIVSILLAVLGCLVYALLSLTAHVSAEWLPILAGWPVLIGWVGIFLYGCRHPFN